MDAGLSKPTLNPSAVPPGDLARMMSTAGQRRFEVEMLDEDVNFGAPVNADGTFNLVQYAAWLVKQMAEGDVGD